MTQHSGVLLKNTHGSVSGKILQTPTTWHRFYYTIQVGKMESLKVVWKSK